MLQCSVAFANCEMPFLCVLSSAGGHEIPYASDTARFDPVIQTLSKL